jgi:hypothetical protein
MKWFIVILILAVVLIAGCTQVSAPINAVICKPNWVLSFSDLGYGTMTDDVCKSQCYASDKVTSYKIESVTNQLCECIQVGHAVVGGYLPDSLLSYENSTPENCNQTCQQVYKNTMNTYGENKVAGNITTQVVKTCYCDVNNCNP